jgi:hypothetical protein
LAIYRFKIISDLKHFLIIFPSGAIKKCKLSSEAKKQFFRASTDCWAYPYAYMQAKQLVLDRDASAFVGVIRLINKNAS